MRSSSSSGHLNLLVNKNMPKSKQITAYSAEEPSFANELMKKRLPFVLKRCHLGLCIEKWNSEYLAEVVGNEEVKIHVSECPSLDFLQKNFSYKTIAFNELIKRASKECQENYFLSQNEYYYLRSVGKDARKDVADIRIQYPELAKDFIIPPIVPNDRIFSSVFRLASKGVTVWTHYDNVHCWGQPVHSIKKVIEHWFTTVLGFLNELFPTFMFVGGRMFDNFFDRVMDNALVQITGEKKAVLFPPSDALNMYLNGDKSEVIDIENPDAEKFPKFLDATKYECLLQPGDVLFIPAFWFHNMKYLDFGIAVNVFWKELDNVFYDKKDPYGNKDLLPAQQAFAGVDKALATLSKLPPSYKDFYCRRLIAHIQKKMENTS